MRSELSTMLLELVGKPMWTCRRAADMAMFQFGARNQTQDFNGRPTEIGDFALHVQCAWRIVRDELMLVGSDDLRYPATHVGEEAIPDDFDWDVHPNRRDRLLQALFDNGRREYTVQSVDLGIAGGCRIVFREGVTLELFPHDSIAHEHWRLFSTAAGGPCSVMIGSAAG